MILTPFICSVSLFVIFTVFTETFAVTAAPRVTWRVPRRLSLLVDFDRVLEGWVCNSKIQPIRNETVYCRRFGAAL
jgi:hypothetical protein